MDFQANQPIKMCLSKITLAAGTTTTLSNTGTTTYIINSRFCTKTAMTNAATPTTDAQTGAAFNPIPANKGSVFLIGFSAAGALLAVQGTIENLNSSGQFINAPQLGGVPDDFCPVGAVIIKAGATASSSPGWLFGSSNMSGVTGITYTFIDLAGMPGRPFIA